MAYGEKGRGSYHLDEGRVAYLITFFDLPWSEEQARRRELQEEMLNELAEVSSKNNAAGRKSLVKTITLGSYPGRENRGELPGGLVVWERHYLVGVRLYLVKAGGEVGSFQERDAEKFHNSFQVME